ncbi:hypothetical protein TruAng_010083 [Truncatella angustata]|nr:hypothetical protein TruAng_010083 [Truncatella angustata]
MHRLGSTWPVHRRPIHPQPYHQIVRFVKRQAWGVLKPESIKPDTPTFHVNNLLLDLDSEAAQNVRQFHPDIDGEPEHRLAKRRRQRLVRSDRIEKFQMASQIEKLNFDNMVADRLYAWHINDLDIAHQALRGFKKKNHSTAQQATATATATATANMDMNTRETAIEPPRIMARGEKTRASFQDLGLQWNGIPEHAARDPTRLITYMLHKQKEAQDRASTILSDHLLDHSLSALIRRQTSFIKLQRIVRFLLEAPNGAQLVSKLSGEIGETSLELAHREQSVSLQSDLASEALVFCNDVVLNLLEQGLPVEKRLWVPGLHLAVANSAFSAARMYLAAGLRSGSSIRDMDDSLLGVLDSLIDSLKAIDTSHGHTPLGPVLSPPQRRAAIFSFLTGSQINGRHSPFSIHSMMQSLESSDYKAFSRYVELLGELGALRTLWHIYQQLARTLQPESSGRPSLNEHVGMPPSIPDRVVNAFLRIARNVTAGHISPRNYRQENLSGKFEEDCQKDLETISRAAVPWYGGRQPVEVTPDPLFVQKVYKAFGNPQITESMRMLRRLLGETTGTALEHVVQNTRS